jgi:hypothetical protein
MFSGASIAAILFNMLGSFVVNNTALSLGYSWSCEIRCPAATAGKVRTAMKSLSSDPDLLFLGCNIQDTRHDIDVRYQQAVVPGPYREETRSYRPGTAEFASAILVSLKSLLGSDGGVAESNGGSGLPQITDKTILYAVGGIEKRGWAIRQPWWLC